MKVVSYTWYFEETATNLKEYTTLASLVDTHGIDGLYTGYVGLAVYFENDYLPWTAKVFGKKFSTALTKIYHPAETYMFPIDVPEQFIMELKANLR